MTRRFRSFLPIGAQLVIALAGLLALAFAPPARGAMLLVPLTGDARSRMAALAVEHGALLVGRGPVAGSLLIRGDRATLDGPLFGAGILLASAPAILCGQTPEVEEEA